MENTNFELLNIKLTKKMYTTIQYYSIIIIRLIIELQIKEQLLFLLLFNY